MNRKPQHLLIVFILLILLAPSGLNAQCAMCKEAAERSLESDPTSMARSLNKGILYLMAVPYLMIAFIFRKQLYQLWKKVSNRYFRSRQRKAESNPGVMKSH